MAKSASARWILAVLGRRENPICWNGGCEMCDYGATTVYEPWGEVGESGDEGGYGSEDVGYGGACSGYSDGEL